MAQIKLTETVKKGGCAAKVAAEVLREILAAVRFPPNDTNVLVDGSTFDDAGIYRVSDDLALVQTLDFFTPIVNDPYTFGQVAAANAMSDVFAMGGDPKTCMAILAFPLATLNTEIIAAVIQGAADKTGEAQANFVGGHSIDDETLKFGLSVTGLVHPDHVWTNAGARAGDVLILTKPLGTGTLMAGLKKSVYSENDVFDALQSMTALNRIKDVLSTAQLSGIHAATDVTGFGLAGHGMQFSQASHSTLSISSSALPCFEKTRASLEQAHLTKAHSSNRTYTLEKIRWSDEVSEIDRLLFFDPQTSGGLLLAVAPEYADEILLKLQERFPKAAKIGEVLPLGDYPIEVGK